MAREVKKTADAAMVKREAGLEIVQLEVDLGARATHVPGKKMWQQL